MGRRLKRKFTRKLAKRRNLADQLFILQRACGAHATGYLQPATLNQQKGMRNHAYAEERNALEIYSQRVRRRCLSIIPRYSAFARLEQARQRMGEKGSSNYLRVFATVHVSRAIRACRLRCNLDRKANHFVFTIWVHHPHSWNPTCILRPGIYKKGAERRAKMVWGGERAAVSCRQTFLANDVGIGKRT